MLVMATCSACWQSPDNLWRWHDRLHSVPQYNSHTFVMPLAILNVKQQPICLCMCENALSLSFFPSNKPFIRVSQTGTSVLCPVNLNKKIQYSIPNGVITVIPWSICFLFSLWIAKMILNLRFNNDHVAYLNAEQLLLLNFLQLWIIWHVFVRMCTYEKQEKKRFLLLIQCT